MITKSISLVSIIVILFGVNAFAVHKEVDFSACKNVLKAFEVSRRYDFRFDVSALPRAESNRYVNAKVDSILEIGEIHDVRVLSSGIVEFAYNDQRHLEASTNRVLTYKLNSLVVTLPGLIFDAEKAADRLSSISNSIKSHVHPIALKSIVDLVGAHDAADYGITDHQYWSFGNLPEDYGQPGSKAETIKAKVDYIANRYLEVAKNLTKLTEYLEYNQVVIENINSNIARVAAAAQRRPDPAAHQQQQQ